MFNYTVRDAWNYGLGNTAFAVLHWSFTVYWTFLYNTEVGFVVDDILKTGIMHLIAFMSPDVINTGYAYTGALNITDSFMRKLHQTRVSYYLNEHSIHLTVSFLMKI